MSFDPVSFLMGKASGGKGGGSGGGTLSEEWDFTSDTPLVGKKLGLVLSAKNMSYSQDGAVFDSTSDYLNFGKIGTLHTVDLFHDYSVSYSSITIEVKVKSMTLVSGDHRRFIMGSSNSGLIYRSTGVWAFYSSIWEEFDETDGSFFDGSIVKVVIDSENKWHIYKDNVLLWEPAKQCSISDGYIGSNSQSINNAVIEWLKIDAVTV